MDYRTAPIEAAELPQRATNALRAAGLTTAGQIEDAILSAGPRGLRSTIPGCGNKTESEVKLWLEDLRETHDRLAASKPRETYEAMLHTLALDSRASDMRDFWLRAQVCRRALKLLNALYGGEDLTEV